MRSIILAAGEGTRLRPHTLTRPKGMVPLLGKALLEHQIETLHTCQVKDIHLVGGYCAHMLPPFPKVINPEYATTNMLFSLLCARQLMEDDILISYADIVYEPRVLQAILASEAPISLTIDLQWKRYWQLRMPDPLTDAESLLLDEKGIITHIGSRPKSYAEIQGQYMGLLRLRRQGIDLFLSHYDALVAQSQNTAEAQTKLRKMDMTSFLQSMVAAQVPLQSVPVENGWLEVDTVEDLAQYEDMQKQGTLKNFWQPLP